MSDLETWVTRAAWVGAVVGACVGLFVRVRRLESAGAVASKSLAIWRRATTGVGALGARMETVERGLVKLSAALESLPDAREFAALGRSVTALQGGDRGAPRHARRHGQDVHRSRTSSSTRSTRICWRATPERGVARNAARDGFARNARGTEMRERF